MAENKKNEPTFTVTDRRHFTNEGEVRRDISESEEGREEKPSTAAAPPPTPAPPPAAEKPPAAQPEQAGDVPPPPTAAEQQAQKDAFDASARQMDERLKQELNLRGHNAQDFDVSFERFIASLYMSALMQLGMVHEQGGTPRVDLIGARQTIDTIGMLHDKTKGNLTPVEENLLQNVLYELRMAYVEVTNALNRAAQQSPPGAPGTPRA